MYIEPNSNIKIYHNVPLDNTYNHTIYFANLSAQNSYFHSNQNILKYNLTSQSYQRVVKGKMRVSVVAENLYDCNYIAFQNASFGTKWFYAFITGVEYVNNVTSEITFEIDVMQTYLFDVSLKQCFIEREHSATDNIGDNLVKENLDIGYEQVILKDTSTNFGTDMCIVIGCTEQVLQTQAPFTFQAVKPTLVNGIVSGVKYLLFNTNTPYWKIFMEVMCKNGKADLIACVYMLPKSWLPAGCTFDFDSGGNIGGYMAESVVSKVNNLSVTRSTNGLDGYYPKNKKLYTYPYNYIYASNGQGNASIYKFEYSNKTNEIDFNLEYDVTPSGSCLCYPRNYRNTTNAHDDNLVLSNLPQGTWSSDSFSAWLQQTFSKEATGVLGNSFVNTAMVSAGVISPLVAGVGIASSIGGLLSSGFTHAIAPDKLHGNLNQGNIQIASRNYEMHFYEYCPKAEYVKIIDDYFNMFGYATHRVKVPNRNVRPFWTYTQTKGCVIQGNCPTDDIKKICSIYDNGITFWNNANNVGNYSLNNSI